MLDSTYTHTTETISIDVTNFLKRKHIRKGNSEKLFEANLFVLKSEQVFYKRNIYKYYQNGLIPCRACRGPRR